MPAARQRPTHWFHSSGEKCGLGDDVVEAIPGPRWKRPSAVRGEKNQLTLLQSARRKYGDIVCLSDRSSLFRQMAGSTGCVAVFGARHTEAVLTRSEVFHTPPPLAR